MENPSRTRVWGKNRAEIVPAGLFGAILQVKSLPAGCRNGFDAQNVFPQVAAAFSPLNKFDFIGSEYYFLLRIPLNPLTPFFGGAKNDHYRDVDERDRDPA
jgi:hypothetical protein